MKEVFGTRNAKKSTYRITDSDSDITVTVPEGKLVIKGRWPRTLATGLELGAQRLMSAASAPGAHRLVERQAREQPVMDGQVSQESKHSTGTGGLS